MSRRTRMLVSLVAGILLTAAFWFGSSVSTGVAHFMIYANIPAVAASHVFSDTPNQASGTAAVLTMVVQWTLVTYLVLWVVARVAVVRSEQRTNDV